MQKIPLILHRIIKLDTILWVFLIAIFLSSRLVFIIHFPLFFDEAIYIHWGQYVMDDSNRLFISMYDGKQPLFIWLVSGALRLTSHPVIAGRIVSVIAGLSSLIGVYLIGKNLWSIKVGYIAAFLYSIIPFFLVYDGLALMDGLLCTFSIWSTYFIFQIIYQRNIKYSIITGIIIGLGLLTKSSANFFLLLLPLGLIIFPKLSKKTIFQFLINCVVIIIISKSLEGILRFSSYFPVIATKNSEFFRSILEFLKNPLYSVSNNIHNIIEWYGIYIGLPIWILSGLSFIFNRKRQIIYFLFSICIPTMIMIFFGKQLYPRHLLFMIWPTVILAAVSIHNILDRLPQNKMLLFPLLVGIYFICLIPMNIDHKLLYDYRKAPIPTIEKWQLINGKPAGIGIDSLRKYLNKYHHERVLIMTDMPLGILPDGIAIYYHKNINYTFIGFDRITDYYIQEYVHKMNPEVTLLILQSNNLPPNAETKLELKIERPENEIPLWYVYRFIRIIPTPDNN
jgi:4-amino-4-deoxy-L-arabinose transferase-like glycosyltransferase